MRNKAILFSSLLFISSSVLAEQSLLEGVAKGTATAVAPKAAEKVEAANQTLEDAKNLKAGAVSAPEKLNDQAEKTVQEAVKKVTPEEAKKAEDVLKAGKETAEKLESAPKSTKAIKKKAAKKALELAH